MQREVKRGDIYFAELPEIVGSEQGGKRPVLVIQNDKGNRYSPTIVVCCLSTSTYRNDLPVHIKLHDLLERPSTIMAEQLKTIDKSRLINYLASCPPHIMEKVDRCLRISLAL